MTAGDTASVQAPLTASAYQDLRNALIRFFARKGGEDAANLADEVFCRLLQNLASRSDVKNIQAFAFGIAHNVLEEQRRHRGRERTVVADPQNGSDPFYNETLSKDLDECLNTLSPKERSLIQAFYAAESGKKAAHRKRLAEEMGLTPNALHIRVSRIRRKLAECIEERQAQGDMKTGRSTRRS